MPRFRYVVADVFTDTPLQGNQVAVFTNARDIAVPSTDSPKCRSFHAAITGIAGIILQPERVEVG